ncbi:hypothetical protein ACK8HX_00850 [Oryzobacter sp. R7]|uniref:hypothetical protein n=1 Tax=Oryzobacter faecalis TaxID=3388656 RepID=UPI00398CE0AD
MTRFAWAAWGLLVVVLDLPLLGWDVVPDVVGYAWLVIGLGGSAALHPAFVRARAAAAVGVPLSVVTGTPLFFGARWEPLLFGALVLGFLVWAGVVHQLLTGLLAVAPAGEEDSLRWAPALRVAAPVVALVAVIGVAASSSALGVLYPLGFVASVVVGILTVVLLHRVNRAGWFTDVAPPPPRATAQ